METIEKSFFTPFVAGTIETLKVLCATEGKVERMGPAHEMARIPIAIAGVIGITGRTFQGAMTLAFSESIFLGLMNRMLSEDNKSITDEMTDGAAELSNIIFGHAKVALNAAGHNIRMALPSVMRGEELNMGAPLTMGATAILITTDIGPMMIEFVGKPVTEDLAALAKATDPATVPKLDAHVLMSFVGGIRQTFRVQCGVEAVAGKPFPKTGENPYCFDIGSLIGVTGAAFGGTIAMAFQKAVFLKILEKMLNEPVPELSPELEDAATEIMNIAFGVAKQVLNEQGYALQMAIPTVIRGKKVESRYPARKPPIVLPFELFGGTFWVEFALDPDTRKA